MWGNWAFKNFIVVDLFLVNIGFCIAFGNAFAIYSRIQKHNRKNNHSLAPILNQTDISYLELMWKELQYHLRSVFSLSIPEFRGYQFLLLFLDIAICSKFFHLSVNNNVSMTIILFSFQQCFTIHPQVLCFTRFHIEYPNVRQTCTSTFRIYHNHVFIFAVERVRNLITELQWTHVPTLNTYLRSLGVTSSIGFVK
jgi:hypothetical protein